MVPEGHACDVAFAGEFPLKPVVNRVPGHQVGLACVQRLQKRLVLPLVEEAGLPWLAASALAWKLEEAGPVLRVQLVDEGRVGAKDFQLMGVQARLQRRAKLVPLAGEARRLPITLKNVGVDVSRVLVGQVEKKGICLSRAAPI